MAIDGMSPGDTAWVLTSAALVLLMTPGLAFFYGGLVRGNNVLNTMMMSIISMGVVAVPWFAYGFSLAFGSGGGAFIGDLSYAGLSGMQDKLWEGTALPALLFAVFQMTFAIIGAAIISGAVVERMRFSAFVVFIFLWSLLVYDVVCHWVWGPGGWIDALGAKDFAGGTVVHETTACAALVLSYLLGPRLDHNPKEKSPPHNVPFVILGAALLWFGWAGFNGGSALAADEAAALALVNTFLAGSTTLVTWLIVERLHAKHASAVGTVTGAIVGLVIITPAAGYVTPIGAVIMSVLGCLLVYPAFQFSHDRLDDSLDCFPCHGVSGFVGTVLTGVFSTDGGLLYTGRFQLLGVQVLAAIVSAAYSMAVTALLVKAISLFLRMRVSEETESLGLDAKVHGHAAYSSHDLAGLSRREPVLEEDHEQEADNDDDTSESELDNGPCDFLSSGLAGSSRPRGGTV